MCLSDVYLSPYYSECAYVATPIAMVQAALTILNESTALPKKWVYHTTNLPHIIYNVLYIHTTNLPVMTACKLKYNTSWLQE